MTRSEFFKALGLTVLSLGVFKLVGDRKPQIEWAYPKAKSDFYNTYHHDLLFAKKYDFLRVTTRDDGYVVDYLVKMERDEFMSSTNLFYYHRLGIFDRYPIANYKIQFLLNAIPDDLS